MKVTDIDIDGLRFDGTRHEALVSMELRSTRGLAPVRVQFVCHSYQPGNCPSTLVTYDLVKDALRQAHRMPGFRRGEQRIEVDVTHARVERVRLA